AQKMQKAAQVLIHTERSIDDIAEDFGSINESKFSAVFRKIMGDTPSVYRNEHTKLKIL
ncbi:MAG: helix-turn-helix domain-containing protein, partial [Clostridia bacterium]|nr:helix-turn-helix domain-containing protein [Clostridia bacterium]